MAHPAILRLPGGPSRDGPLRAILPDTEATPIETQQTPPMSHGPINPRFSSEALTRAIRVRVSPFYLPDHSDPTGNKWVFAYRVRITNEGERKAKLLTRRWVITDAQGRAKLVEGEGVVGQSPDLMPG